MNVKGEGLREFYRSAKTVALGRNVSSSSSRSDNVSLGALFLDISVVPRETDFGVRYRFNSQLCHEASHSPWTLSFLICKMTIISTTSQACDDNTAFTSCCIHILSPFREIVSISLWSKNYITL